MQLERTILLSSNWKIEVDAYNYALKYQDKQSWKVIEYHRSLQEAISKYVNCRFLNQKDSLKLNQIVNEMLNVKNQIIKEFVDLIEVE